MFATFQPREADVLQAMPQIDDMAWRPEATRLSERDFLRIASLVGELIGIKLPINKRLMIEGRLRRRVRALGFSSMDDYCHFLFERNGLAGELTHLINAVTTNKTDFFRESEHFDFLERKIVPALLENSTRFPNPTFKLWSAASSNGAEAYTIAMVMAEIAARGRDLSFSILGTDISTEMLDQASRAIYSEEIVAPVPPAFQRRYFLRGSGPAHGGKVRVTPELRRFVQFQRLNLMDERYPVDRDVDVIFLRNVLIYFEKETQDLVVRRMAGHLRPGGFLILGHSESMIGSNLGMRQWAPGVFQHTR